MIKQVFGILLLLYTFALLQMSFFTRLFPNGWIPNLVMLSVVFLSIFERRDSYASFAAALFSGFLLDIFSGGIIGFWSLTLLVISLLIKFVLEEYVRLPIPKKF
ncbi:MAG TPA: rod shape-determining protein MreD [Candidatus Wildermuthbacteria bacterium]|uniref:Rod shape-determining protein MreD n=1 Tax=Candidatus Yanofskybacteria bacterium GW2011_GWC1_48_11 TaxID=1619027 RepID=A0A837ILE0_9BACT|nr:MAG: hypothetical protein UY25_C0002G0003 [Candidatus Yanofskybacteria bacterium GW2011_GWC1_48_11]KKW08951.1 MAG: hypothetical protein UY45_C0002G0003 [Parcubacteria group bacterium GW2011_GWA1_49_26]OHA61007.1 MAG: rod shape-determining protein MreD [Candidatus Wildermuthbacteria bacterium GWA1_49_26]OHA66073.1 MAG: rod shape-determining protein MreD [Candidatus Wildermuthbacteria bacterium RIFCSPHIGHO2_01_FULL_50_47]OHA69258.1 MAG: rod shape-determining protein MreD [Candidatus Wildermuth